MRAHRLSVGVIFAGAISLLIGVSAEENAKLPSMIPAGALKLPIEGELPSLGGATGWLNSQPLTAHDLHGKVVLIDFWTYSCINWRRRCPMSARGPRNTRIKDWW